MRRNKSLFRLRTFLFLWRATIFASASICACTRDPSTSQRCIILLFVAGRYLAGGQSAKLVVGFLKLGFTLRPASLWVNGRTAHFVMDNVIVH